MKMKYTIYIGGCWG